MDDLGVPLFLETSIYFVKPLLNGWFYTREPSSNTIVDTIIGVLFDMLVLTQNPSSN